MIAPILWHSSLRYLGTHRWLLSLSILGVALGVAVVVAIDLANASARTAFDLSSETVTGKATHRIVSGANEIGDSVYVSLRTRVAAIPSAPVIEAYASTQLAAGRTFQVLGVDPFAERPFRPYVSAESDAAVDIAGFLSGENEALISAATADELGVAIGDLLPLETDGVNRTVRVAGLIQSADDRSASAVANLLVTDISTAQHLFSMPGRLSYIDLILGPDDVGIINSLLPEGTEIVRSSSRSESLAQMTRAFELNLTALSLLALVVGMFLTYNTINFSVVQRRPLIGRLRAVGVTRREVFVLVLAEALVIGAAGTAVGVFVGVVLGRGLVQLVTRTINDLYYVVSVRTLTIAPATLAKGVLLGLGATLVSAWLPARSATRSSPSTVLQRSFEESRIRGLAPRLATLGAVFGMVGAVILVVPSDSIAASYVALFLLLMGFALVTPATINVLVRAVRPVMDRMFGAIGRMATSGISATLSRTSVAIAALMIAVAATIGVGVMVASFRTTVVTWLNDVLQADVYVQPPNLVFRGGEARILPALMDEMRVADGVAESYGVRHVQVTTSVGLSQLSAVETRPRESRALGFKEGDAATAMEEFVTPGVVVISEPYAYRHGLARNDTLRILTDKGERPFRIAGVYYDYASDQGVVLMHRKNYESVFDDRGFSGLALYVESGRSLQDVVAGVQALAIDRQQLIVRSNRDLRQYSLEIFDRTFTITLVLRLLAVLVAFVGVLSALLSLQLERAEEFRVLRAVGMTQGQRQRYIMIQTGLIGGIAGFLAVPLGLLLAWVLIFVINRRSFGWTLQFEANPEILLQAIGVSIGAAMLAGAASLLVLRERR